MLTVMSAMTLRFKSYIIFMKQVAHHIVEGYLIHRALVEDKAWKKAKAEAHLDKKAGYLELTYPDGSQVRGLEPIASIHCFDSLIKKSSEVVEVESFLANLSIQPASQDLRGITWLELYVLYRIRGGVKIIPDPPNPALPRGSADKQIRAFRRSVRSVVERTLNPDTDGGLFRPGPAKCNNLLGVGILGKQACLRLNVKVLPNEGEAIAIALSMLNRGGPIKLHKKFIKGDIKLLPHVLKLKGKAVWDSNLPTMTTPIASRASWSLLFKEECYEALPQVTMLKCPGCDGVESSYNPVFQFKDLDRKAKCGFCKHSSPVRRWTCPCGKAWHTCLLHAGAYKPYFKEASGKQLLSGHLSISASDDKAINVNLKASRRFRTPEDIIQQDHRKAKALKIASSGIKRKADITFNLDDCQLKKPTRLGPILRERFGGASSSSSAA